MRYGDHDNTSSGEGDLFVLMTSPNEEWNVAIVIMSTRRNQQYSKGWNVAIMILMRQRQQY